WRRARAPRRRESSARISTSAGDAGDSWGAPQKCGAPPPGPGGARAHTPAPPGAPHHPPARSPRTNRPGVHTTPTTPPHDPGDAIRDVVCTVRIRAKVPGVRLYHAGFAYPTDQRPGVLAVEPIRGGTVADVKESPTGAIAVYFLLDRDIDVGDAQPYDLCF